MSGEKFRIKFAVYLIPRDGNKVLLSLRENTGFMDGKYGLVSGHVEEGETADEAVIREAKEESGVDISIDDINFVYAMHRLKDQPQDDYIDLYFECKNWQGEFTNAEPEKCGGLEWFDIDTLPNNTIPYIVEVLSLYQTGKHYSSKRKADV